MHIVLNGHSIENAKDPTEIACIIFSFISDLNYWSCESLRELYVGVFAIITKYCKEKIQTCSIGSEKRKYTKFINKKRHLSTDRDKMLSVIYELVLSSENLNRIHGFGFSNKFGDSISGDAEWARLTKIK